MHIICKRTFKKNPMTALVTFHCYKSNEDECGRKVYCDDDLLYYALVMY